jgi:CheY-like chemotaxis protein
MRTLCRTCKEVWVEPIPRKLQRWIPEGSPLYRAVGCPECAMTGYRGRFSIVEILNITPEVEKLVGAGVTADRIADAARHAGMRSLWDSGLSHVLRGDSTIDELLRVVDVPQEDERGDSMPAAESGGTATATPSTRKLADASTQVATPARKTPERGQTSFEGSFELLEPVDGAPRPVTDAKVLLVDDEDQLRRVMRDLLERDGYSVTEARDGVEALDQIDRHAPDIIVLDLNLPGLDGYGVLSHLRSRPATVDIPVVVLTAQGDEDNEVRVFEMGADDFLSKPFRARALSARLQAVLSRSSRGGSRRDS